MSSDSKPELLLLKQFWRSRTAIELSGNNFESSFAGAGTQRAVENFNFLTEDLLTELFTVKEDFGWGITTVTTKEI